MKWHGRAAAVVAAVGLSASVGVAVFLSYGQAPSADRPVPALASPAPSGVAGGPSDYVETSTPGSTPPGSTPPGSTPPAAGPVGTPTQSPQTAPRTGTPVVPSADGTLVLGEVHL